MSKITLIAQLFKIGWLPTPLFTPGPPPSRDTFIQADGGAKPPLPSRCNLSVPVAPRDVRGANVFFMTMRVVLEECFANEHGRIRWAA
ncbi:unnamed protein product [Mesocestoides corti]|uniref:Uncharacterized protein n=1 Tax=Mesocestoides corti TaxID=53468 RepID=A0A0R3U2Y3_MESCO|nr:unnamed protein product [Mesocestoides corti]